jgi:hypothetical protein
VPPCGGQVDAGVVKRVSFVGGAGAAERGAAAQR